jgi:hypothetical protein
MSDVFGRVQTANSGNAQARQCLAGLPRKASDPMKTASGSANLLQ